MTTAPHPAVIARHLRDVAELLDRHGDRAVALAPLLAARGWPTSTTGDGTGSRGNAELTSVERAAAHADQWADIDQRLTKTLRLIWHTGLEVQTLVGRIASHGADDDQLPAGAGGCLVCDHVCRPDTNPHDRLRSGLCPKDHQACLRWTRAGYGTRQDWIAVRLRERAA